MAFIRAQQQGDISLAGNRVFFIKRSAEMAVTRGINK